jgi:hypothetical protein
MKEQKGGEMEGWEGLKSTFAINKRHGSIARHIDHDRVVAKIDAVRNAACLAHEISRLYCNAIGVTVEPSWAYLKYTQREAITDRVMDIIEKGDMSPKDFHNRWMNRKKNCGWKHGNHFDRIALKDPFITEWENLPLQVRMMDTLFVDCVSGYLSSVLYPGENASRNEEENEDIDVLLEETDPTMFEKIEHCVKTYPAFLSTLSKKFEEAGINIPMRNRDSKRAYAKKVIKACIQDPCILDAVMAVLSLRT